MHQTFPEIGLSHQSMGELGLLDAMHPTWLRFQSLWQCCCWRQHEFDPHRSLARSVLQLRSARIWHECVQGSVQSRHPFAAEAPSSDLMVVVARYRLNADTPSSRRCAVARSCTTCATCAQFLPQPTNRLPPAGQADHPCPIDSP